MAADSPHQDARKRSRKRYRSKQAHGGGFTLSTAELNWLRARKNATPWSWRDLAYRGLGVLREEFLASRKQSPRKSA